ncbi:MAG: tripartite tricarboxylate transporter TctB family protein [Sphaerochaetaceae bacterium]|jgi:putative tricarboxylic transport membrane protein
MKKTNFIVSGVFAAFAIIIIVIAAGYPPSNHGVPGPGLFPILIACLILISALTLTIHTIRMPKEKDVAVDLKSRNVLNVYVTMAGLIVYVVLLPKVGFIVTTAVMLTLYIKWFGKYPWWKSLLIGVIFSVAVFLLFGYVLNVPMRFGLLI